VAARYAIDPSGFKLAEIVVVLGQTVEAWLGDSGGAARFGNCMNR